MTAGREQFIAALAVVCFVNGIVPRVLGVAVDAGFWPALANTFNVSGIVWIALWLALETIWTAAPSPLTRRDLLVGGALAVAALAPLSELSWIAFTAAAIYGLWTAPSGSDSRRGFLILLATSVPMLWSRLLFKLFAEPILNADATLVSLIVRTDRSGNAVEFADGSGYLWVASPCSSLANVSLAILCWVTIMQVYKRRLTLKSVGWCVAACAGVVAVNVARLSLLAFFPQHFELIHGVVGGTIVSWIILVLTVTICVAGVGRAEPAKA